jgi:uncharacterized protein (DUF58 family)
MFFGSQLRTKSVVAAELAALASFRVLKEGDRVGGVVFADQGVDIIFPKRDRRNILRFLEKIVERNHELEKSSPLKFEEALEETMLKIRNIVSHDFLIMIISDFHRYSPKVIKFISRLAQHNDVILAKVYDPMERDIPAAKVIAGNGEKQIVMDGENKRLRQKFREGFDQDYASFETQMKKHRIPLMLFDTITAVDEQLKDILKGTKR